MLRLVGAFSCVIALAACQTGTTAPEVGRAEFGAVPLSTIPENACWTTDHIPAVTETTFVQDQTGARVARDTVIRPAEERLFAVPCPADLHEGFIASLQRALMARGLYAGGDHGTYDAATADAVRQFQAPLGLNSGTLSLQAAQRLGLVAIPRADQ